MNSYKTINLKSGEKMHVLYLDWPCFGGEDALFAFRQKGIKITKFAHEDYHLRKSESFNKEISSLIEKEDIDFAFSFNFYPLLARACNEHNIKYISIVYNSPQVKLYSYTVTYPTNYIFHFDSVEVEHFRANGINTLYYMPLPVNSEKINYFLKQPYNKEACSSDISFVGALYNEAHNFFDRLGEATDHTKGFLQGLMDAQSLVYGYNFMEEALTKEVIDDLQRVIDYAPCEDGVETLPYIISEYILARKLTSNERIKLLTSIGKHIDSKTKFTLWTKDKSIKIPGIDNRGPTDYYMDLPYIFHHSKINLNISLRSIKSGIPLRCMDILSYGGFLLTNYQSDLLRHFEPGADFVYFESEKDMLNKIDYYLAHEDERVSIAKSGYETTRKYFNYDNIFNYIFSIVFEQK